MRLSACKELARAPARASRAGATKAHRAVSHCVKIGAERVQLLETPTHARAPFPCKARQASRHYGGAVDAAAMLYKQANLRVHIMRANAIFLIGNCLNNGHRRYMAWAVEIPRTGERTRPWPNASNARPRRSISFPLGDARSRATDSKSTEDHVAAAPRVDFGSGWYHDAAIEARSEPARSTKRRSRRGFGAREPELRQAPKIDQPSRLDSISSAIRPRCELPEASNPGDHTAIEALPGATARIPPPTPLLPGSPTR